MISNVKSAKPKEPKQCLILDRDSFDKDWEKMNHWWFIKKRYYPKKEHNSSVIRYACQMNPHHNHIIKNDTNGGRTKNSKSHTCEAKLVVKFKEGQVFHIRINNHNHDHTSYSKISSYNRKTATEELSKGYKPKEVTKVLKNMGVAVNRQTVVNISRKVVGEARMKFNHSENLKDDYQELLYWLRDEKNIVFEQFQDPNNSMNGISWIKKDTNYWGYILTSIVCQDRQGVWIPCGHLLLRQENSTLIKLGLTSLKSLCSAWKPRYFIVDDSATEQKGIMDAFPGLSVGEQQVSIFCALYILIDFCEERSLIKLLELFIVFRSCYSLLERNISAFIVGVVWAHRFGRT